MYFFKISTGGVAKIFEKGGKGEGSGVGLAHCVKVRPPVVGCLRHKSLQRGKGRVTGTTG